MNMVLIKSLAVANNWGVISDIPLQPFIHSNTAVSLTYGHDVVLIYYNDPDYLGVQI